MIEKEFEVRREDTPEGVKFIIRGRIDSINADVLEQNLEKSLNDKQVNIILNMLFVDYLCSTGIRVILKAYKGAAAAGGKLEIEKPSERVRNVMGMAALDLMLVKREDDQAS